MRRMRGGWPMAIVGTAMMIAMLTGTGAGLFKVGQALAAMPTAVR